MREGKEKGKGKGVRGWWIPGIWCYCPAPRGILEDLDAQQPPPLPNLDPQILGVHQRLWIHRDLVIVPQNTWDPQGSSRLQKAPPGTRSLVIPGDSGSQQSAPLTQIWIRGELSP